MLSPVRTWFGYDVLQSSHSKFFQKNVLLIAVSFVTFLLLSHSYKQIRCIYFIVPLHLHGENNGFSRLFSSERHILHKGGPLLDWEVSLITRIGVADISLPFGKITLFGKFKWLKFPSFSIPIFTSYW